LRYGHDRHPSRLRISFFCRLPNAEQRRDGQLGVWFSKLDYVGCDRRRGSCQYRFVEVLASGTGKLAMRIANSRAAINARWVMGGNTLYNVL